MATDATGTPTSPDNIPTFNTAVDAPSGLGFNAAMAAIQTALSNRITTPASIATGEVPVWNGSTWVRSSVQSIGRANISGQPFGSMQIFGAGTGTYTTPAGVKAILVHLVAGGGGGGGVSVGSAGQAAVGGGGGGGAYSMKLITSPLASYAYTVGAGGAGGAAGANNGVAGNDSTFGTTVVVAKAGGLGNGMASSAAPPVQAPGAGAGGAASGGTGDIKISGGNGWIGMVAVTGGIGMGGSGGASGFNGSQTGPTNSNAAGGATGIYGGGGAGAIRTSSTGSHAGGNGGDGLLMVWEFY